MIYLIHFDEPISRGILTRTGGEVWTRHYIGYTAILGERLQRHRSGGGANLLRVLRERGIGWRLARTWDGTRHDERRLKNWRKARKLCPVCRWPDRFADHYMTRSGRRYRLRPGYRASFARKAAAA